MKLQNDLKLRLENDTWLVLATSSEATDASDGLPLGQISPVFGTEAFGLVLEEVPLVGVGPLPPPLTPGGHLRLRPVTEVSFRSEAKGYNLSAPIIAVNSLE